MLSIPHLIVIFVVALVVFGPEKLPELARNLGKVMAEFRRHTNELRSTFEGHLRDLEREAEARKIGGSLPAPAAPSPALAQPAAPAPGTVPANPPNAAAMAAPADTTPPETAADPSVRRTDAGNDPYLMGTEFAPVDSASQAAAAGRPEPSAAEKASERVTDGDVRPA